MARWCCLAAMLAGLIGCAHPEAGIGLDGSLVILRPMAGFSTARLSDDWMIAGTPPKTSPAAVSEDGQLSLRFEAGGKAYALMRRVNAQLLATPYLAWRWQQLGAIGVRHPVRIVVGLADAGGKNRKGMFGRLLSHMTSTAMPDFDRSIIVSFGSSALMRGSLDASVEKSHRRGIARYVVRGGRENLKRWWNETVDLSNLHRLAWPGIDMRATRIVYIGVTVQASAKPASGRFGEIRLSR